MFDNLPVSKTRIEALSDGVFAVVLTLLVIDLKPEFSAREPGLRHELLQLLPHLLAYAVTFIIACAFWFQHHCWLGFLRQAARRTFWYNSFFLFAITLLPFSVSALLANGGTATGAVLYYGNMVLIPLALALCWLHARRQQLLTVTAPPTVVRRFTGQCWAFMAGGVAGVIIARFSPQLAGFIYILPVVVFRIWARRQHDTAPTVAA